MGEMTIEEIKEYMRLRNAKAMVQSKTVCFNFDKTKPDFKGEYFDPAFLSQYIFRPTWMSVDSVWT